MIVIRARFKSRNLVHSPPAPFHLGIRNPFPCTSASPTFHFVPPEPIPTPLMTPPRRGHWPSPPGYIINVSLAVKDIQIFRSHIPPPNLYHPPDTALPWGGEHRVRAGRFFVLILLASIRSDAHIIIAVPLLFPFVLHRTHAPFGIAVLF